MIFLRSSSSSPHAYALHRKFGPKTPDDPSCNEPCIACGEELTEGCYTALVPLGPGDNEDEQGKYRSGRPYNAVAVEIHWECAGGEPV